MPVSCCNSLMRARICACVVTSSAVVGSSAMSSAGLQISAMAIMARWRMPPDSSNGYVVSIRFGSRKPTRVNTAIAASSAVFWSAFVWIFSASVIWSPTVCSGDSEVIGSWKIIAMRAPRRLRISSPSGASVATSTGPPEAGSLKSIWPDTMRPRFGRSRRSALAVTDFPEPDSPTTASVLPFGMSKDRFFTA